MTKAPLVVTALFILTGCTTTANLKATPLKEQSAAQIDSDRKRCAEWSKKTAARLAGFPGGAVRVLPTGPDLTL